MLYRVNDKNALNFNSSDINYKKVIEKAHNNNIFIYAGAIIPYFLWIKQIEKEKY